MAKKEKTIGMRVDTELDEVLSRLAEEEQRTPAGMARVLVIEALTKRKAWPPKGRKK